MKEIGQREIDLLVKKHYITNTNNGYVDRRGNAVGFYRTKNKRYIEDKFVDISKRLS